MTTKTVVMRNINEIKPDPDQPRKEFNEDDIAATALTIESQGLINPIEIDENNMIVTGEIRWRSAKRAGLTEIPCVVWENGTHKRFERQVIENLHHHKLTDREREDAIVKLWETVTYPTQEQLGKAVGLSPNRISVILEANEFRKRSKVSVTEVSTSVISDTAGLDDYTRDLIIRAVELRTIKADDIRVIRKIARASDTLLEKTLEGSIDVDRAIETAEAIVAIEEQVDLTDDQKDRLVHRVEQDEELLDKYKEDVLHRVKKVMTTPKAKTDVIQEPIGRKSPVRRIIAVKDDILDHFRVYVGNCDADERQWARRVIVEIRDELNLILDVINPE